MAEPRSRSSGRASPAPGPPRPCAPRGSTVASCSSAPRRTSPTSGPRCRRATCRARAEAPFVHPAEWYAEQDVDLRLGTQGHRARPGRARGRDGRRRPPALHEAAAHHRVERAQARRRRHPAHARRQRPAPRRLAPRRPRRDRRGGLDRAGGRGRGAGRGRRGHGAGAGRPRRCSPCSGRRWRRCSPGCTSSTAWTCGAGSPSAPCGPTPCCSTTRRSPPTSSSRASA